MARLVVALALLFSTGRAEGAVLDDPRLQPVRAELDSVVAAAARDGVPLSLLDDKLREGLAKNVPAARIAPVVRSLEGALSEAVKLTAPHLPSPPPSLLKALVEARAAGAQPRDLQSLLQGAAARGPALLTRAVDVLTDLSQRGFPVQGAVRAITAVVSREPRALEQVAATAQSLAGRGDTTRAEALEAIARAAEKGLGPSSLPPRLIDRATEALGKTPPGQDDRGPIRESSGQRGPGFNHGKGKP